jgi:TolB-like protein/DNA-binding winged helix-turn-helix (wHTH) protein/Flp pilus assembly protein TadD
MGDREPARFGVFEIGADGQLRKRGVPVRLHEQPQQVLRLLIDHAGTLVTREELRQALWPDDTWVDFDNAVNGAISKIRRALGDEAQSPVFIETVPRRGYRFIAPLQHGPAPELPAPTTSGRFDRRWALILLSVAAASIVTVAGVWALRHLPPVRSHVTAIVVLPFSNLMGTQDSEYLADGLTDALTTDIAQLRGVRVISRQSAMQYRNVQKPARDLARELGIDTIVQGSISPAADGIVIQVQLVDADTDAHLWASRFRASSIDLAVVDEIAAEIADAIGAPLPAASLAGRRISAQPPEARLEYLRARFFWNKRTDQAMAQAVAHLKLALDVAPEDPLVWAAVADIYAVGSDRAASVFDPPVAGTAGGIRAAERALARDPNLGEAHAALGKLYINDWRWRDAVRELARAIDLSPQYSTGLQWYGMMLAGLGQCEQAITLTRKGAEIDPLTPMVNEAVGSVYIQCGQPELAIPEMKRLTQMHPDFASAHQRLANAYARAGRYAEAIPEFRRALELGPDSDRTKGALAFALAASGDRQGARRIAAELETGAATDHASRYFTATAELAAGNERRFFELLDVAVRNREPEVGQLFIDWRLRRFHHDPRFRALLERAGFVPQLVAEVRH